jgi:hypothetical protein
MRALDELPGSLLALYLKKGEKDVTKTRGMSQDNSDKKEHETMRDHCGRTCDADTHPALGFRSRSAKIHVKVAVARAVRYPSVARLLWNTERRSLPTYDSPVDIDRVDNVFERLNVRDVRVFHGLSGADHVTEPACR